MAIVVFTKSPRRLLRLVYEAIGAGAVATWEMDADGDLTHTSAQMRRVAWLHPEMNEGRLLFTIIPRRTGSISTLVYAYYHGHFTQMLLTHFDDEFEEVMSTAAPSLGDATR